MKHALLLVVLVVVVKRVVDLLSTVNQTQSFTGFGTQCLGDVTTNRTKPIPDTALEVFSFALNGINILFFVTGP